MINNYYTLNHDILNILYPKRNVDTKGDLTVDTNSYILNKVLELSGMERYIDYIVIKTIMIISIFCVFLLSTNVGLMNSFFLRWFQVQINVPVAFPTYNHIDIELWWYRFKYFFDNYLSRILTPFPRDPRPPLNTPLSRVLISCAYTV